MIFGPDGAPLVEPLQFGEEEILYAGIDLSTIDFSKQAIDAVGHYSRPDLLSLLVNPEAAKQSYSHTITLGAFWNINNVPR